MTVRKADRIRLDGYFLPPPIKIAAFKTTSFDGVRIRQPLLTQRNLSDIIDHLISAQEQYLSKQSIDRLMDILDTAVARWLNPDDPIRKMAEAALPAVTGLSGSMVRQSLDTLLKEYRKEALGKILDQSLGDRYLLDEFRASPRYPGRLQKAFGPRLTTHIMAGNIPGLGMIQLMTTLLTKSACLCKLPAEEPVTTALFARTLIEIEPPLADCIAIVFWKGGSRGATALEKTAFGRSELVTATGSDSSVSAVQKTLARYQKTPTRFIAYGHRVSLGLVGRDAIKGRGLQTTARLAALDIAMLDQQGCLSPHLFYMETGGAHTPQEFARAVAHELEQVQKELPRGTVDAPVSSRIHRVRSLAEIKLSDNKEVVIHASETGTLWTVIYEADPVFTLSPLYRTVRIKPIGDLLQVIPLLEPWRQHLQAVGIATKQSRQKPLAEALGRSGVNRICPIGRMQQPPAGWSQDGRRFISDWVRWVDLESSE